MTASNIEWTQHVWNPLAGCSVHSPGCTNCYAMKMAYRLEAMAKEQMMLRDSPLAHYCGTTTKVNGKAVWTGQVNLSEAALLAPLRRRKPTTWFVNSMSDLFHENVPDETIDRIFAVMALSPQHTFQLLTKRSARMRDYMAGPDRADAVWGVVEDLLDDWHEGGGRMEGIRLPVIRSCRDDPGDALLPALGAHGAAWGGERPWPLKNLWLGVSAEDQPRWDARTADLKETPAAVRWVSAEPLLGPIEGERDLHALYEFDFDTNRSRVVSPKIDWVVTGGESGRGHRDNNFEANARSLLDQCRDAGVAFFGKQNVGKGPLPEDLMVREFPA